METNECYVYYAIDGDGFNPDEVTKAMGLEPTSTIRKGSKIPNEIPKFSCWKLSTGRVVQEIIDVETMALDVIRILHTKIDTINSIKKRFNATTRLQVVLWISTDENQSTPAIGFGLEIMNFLVKTGAFIDIDTYKH